MAGDEAGARKLIHQTLRRRATAKQRIGVSYRICEIIDPGHWVQLQQGTELVGEHLQLTSPTWTKGRNGIALPWQGLRGKPLV